MRYCPRSPRRNRLGSLYVGGNIKPFVKQLSAVVAIAGAALIMGAGSASAYQIIRYTGLYVYDDDNGNGLVGEIDYTTNINNKAEKIDNDPYGDRLQIQTPFRDRAPANGAGVHTSVDWAKNGTYCYVSGIGQGSGSVACGSGWNAAGHTETSNISDSAWHFWSHQRAYDPYSDSIRGGVHICQAEFDADPCSGKRYMGISY